MCNVKQQTALFFQINVSFQILASSTCFEQLVFIIRKTICTSRFVMFCMHASEQSGRLDDVLHKSMENMPYKAACTI